MNKTNIRAYIAWIAICIIWGTTYLAIRIGVTDLPPMLFAGLRWIAAGTILIVIQRALGNQFPAKNEIKHLAIVGIALLGIANGLVVVAEQWLPSGLTALLITTLPFWMVGFESFLPKGPKFNAVIISGLIIGLSGVFLIFGKDFENWIRGDYLFGVLALMGAVISWSLGSIYSKYKKLNVHLMMGASVQMLIAGALQTSLGLILGEYNNFHLTQNGFYAIAYLIIFGSIFGYVSYIYAIHHLPLSLVSTYAYINPVIALILGWYFLDENLSTNILFAAGLIFIGVTLVKKGNMLALSKNKV
ncbi:putative inner membrane transporter YedA [bacterium BMS3Abin03]|nr:putative inner membrane transporter YedA [bacterium BMS3Abin03]